MNAQVKILQWLHLTGYLTLKELLFTIEEEKKELEMLQRDSTKIEMWGGRCGVSTTSLYVVSISVLGCLHTKYNIFHDTPTQQATGLDCYFNTMLW